MNGEKNWENLTSEVDGKWSIYFHKQSKVAWIDVDTNSLDHLGHP